MPGIVMAPGGCAAISRRFSSANEAFYDHPKRGGFIHYLASAIQTRIQEFAPLLP